MITPDQYYKGRDKKYASELTPEIQLNVAETLRRANLLLVIFSEQNPGCGNRGCNSGWRPAAVNAATPNAAKKSKHMLGLAIDVSDEDGSLDAWLMTKVGLWMEHPSATPGWAHLQTVSPKSGNRVFYP